MFIPSVKLALKSLPDALAFPLMRRIAQTPQRSPLKERDRQAVAKAEAISWGEQGRKHGWRWNAGNGPRVLLVHGWGGRATQMAALAQHLAWLGFDVTAVDITAHGASPGEQMSFRNFILDIQNLAATCEQPLHALIGHSAGGMAAMAARLEFGIEAARFVCLNAPVAPYPPIEAIKKILNPRASLLNNWQAHVVAQFPLGQGAMETGGLYEYLGQGELLVINDCDDDQVRSDDQKIIQSRWPNARCLTTRGLGHNGILWADSVHIQVGDFLTAANPTQAAA